MNRMFSRLRGRWRGLRSGLAGDVAYMSVWQGSNIAVDLALTPLITYTLGLEAFGVYSTIAAVVILVGTFMSARTGVAATTFGTRALETGDEHDAARIFSLCLSVAVVTGVVALALLGAAAPLLGNTLAPDGAALIALYGLSVLAREPLATSMAVLRVKDRFQLIAWLSVALDATRLAIAAIALIVFSSLPALMGALALGQLLKTGAFLFVARDSFRVAGHFSTPRKALRGLDRTTKTSLVHTLVHTNNISYQRVAQVNLPTVLLGAIGGPTDAAIYKLGTIPAATVGALIDPATAALLPRVARMWARKQFREIRALLESAVRVSAVLSIGVFVVLVIFREPIIELLGAGEVPSSAETVLVLAGLSQLIYALSFWRSLILFAAERARTVSYGALVGTAIQLVALVPAIIVAGPVGAACALVLSRIVVNAALSVIAARELNSRIRASTA
jgi:O-antigen/teichoic acid export membrane protein